MTYIRKYYQNIPNEYCIYFIKIENKNIFKIGRTNKFKIRLKNLKVSLYEKFSYEILKCCCRESSIKKEKFLKKELECYNIIGEWYDCNIEIIDNLKSIITKF